MQKGKLRPPKLTLTAAINEQKQDCSTYVYGTVSGIHCTIGIMCFMYLGHLGWHCPFDV